MVKEPTRDDSPGAKKEPKLRKIGRFENPADETSKVTESLDSPDDSGLDSAQTEPMSMSFETEKVSGDADDSVSHGGMIPVGPPRGAHGMSGQMTDLLDDQIPEPETEGVTEGVTEDVTEDVTEGVGEDGDVLVLLPDEPAYVETQEVAQSSLEDVPLKTTNPLAGIDEIPVSREVNPFSGAGAAASASSGPGGENIGVIDEIAELATSLDQDILSADERTVQVEDFQAPPPPPPRQQQYPAARGRRKRSKALVLTGTLAAAILIGLFVVAELKGWLHNGPAGGVATASGTGKKSGTPAGKVNTVKPPPSKGGAVVKSGPKTPGGKTPVEIGTGTPPELSVTRIAVRQKVQAAVRLGLQGLVKKE